MGIVLLIIGLLLFVGLVVIHEFGHFIMARRNGVEVEEFGIGFPPKLWSKQVGRGKKKFLFSLNWLPLGGFVRMKGEHDSDTEPGTFGAASLWGKTKIMAAGIVMNALVAFVLFMILAWIGMPQLIENQFTIKSDTTVTRNDVLVGTVQPDSPAAQAGLQTRDRLVSLGVAGKPAVAITSAADVPKLTEQYQGQAVLLRYARDGDMRTARLTLLSTQQVTASKKTSAPKGHLGISPAAFSLQRSTWSAPLVAAGIMKQFTVLTFQGLGHAIAALFHGNGAAASSQVSGPVGIFVVLKQGSLLGYQFMLMIVAIISLSLAIMNVLPIPALDGGKLFVTYVSRLLRKPLTEKMEDYIYGTSFVFLLALIAVITVVDVRRFF